MNKVGKAENEKIAGLDFANAQLLKKLETVENALKDNAKIVIPKDPELVNVIGDLAGVLPIRKSKEGEQTRDFEK